jgi:hypothetical protein
MYICLIKSITGTLKNQNKLKMLDYYRNIKALSTKHKTMKFNLLILFLLFFLHHVPFSSAQDMIAMVGPNGLYGYVDSKGNIEIEYKFGFASNFRNGMARVADTNMKFGYLNQSGNLVIGFKFDNAWNFNDEDIARVYLNGKIGFIDKTGNLVHGWYKYLCPLEYNIGLVEKDDTYGFINEISGKMISDWYDSVTDFNEEGLSLVSKDKKMFYINRKGEYVRDYK